MKLWYSDISSLQCAPSAGCIYNQHEKQTVFLVVNRDTQKQTPKIRLSSRFQTQKENED